eukprot:Phypoly_transcript_07574.p1 GENE.Phypoly_transcript_07574~~Phypoly_transcript_07574.p1  ORF type:complete len:523 (+),score=112.08 Phypoly_transcript_07574:110-1570(+)
MKQAVHSIQRAKRDIFTAEQILLLPPNDLHRIALLSPSQAASFIAHLSAFVVQSPRTLMDFVTNPSYGLRLSWGDPILDHYFRGGLNPTGITEISGESAAGKSQLCMQLLLQAQLPVDMGGLGGSSLYLSTEDLPMKRLSKLAEHYRREKYTTPVKQEEGEGGSTSLLHHFDLMANIFVEKVGTIDAMWNILSAKIGQLISQPTPVKLVVIDSLAALFRDQYSRDEAWERSKVLWNYANQLKYISDTYNICIVVVNQVSSFFEDTVSKVAVQENQKLQFEKMVGVSGTGGKFIPSLGLAWSNCVNTRIIVSRTQRAFRPKKRKLDENEVTQESSDRNVLRKMRVAMSPNLPELTCMFIVDSHGVKGVEVDSDGNTFTEPNYTPQPTFRYYASQFKMDNEENNNFDNHFDNNNNNLDNNYFDNNNNNDNNFDSNNNGNFDNTNNTNFDNNSYNNFDNSTPSYNNDPNNSDNTNLDNNLGNTNNYDTA